MPYFVGEFDQKIDDKNRLSISSSLRDLMNSESDGTNFFLVLGTDDHLWLYPDRYFMKLTSRMKRGSLGPVERERIDRWYASARQVKPDSQGRVVVPEKSMQRATIDREVTLVGNQDHIEIWPTAEHEARMAGGLDGSMVSMLDAAADELADMQD